MFCLYEYARESPALVAWATNRGPDGWPKRSEFGHQLEQEWPEVYHLLMHLASDLAADTPWQEIRPEKVELAIGKNDTQQTGDIEPPITPPSIFFPWPWQVRPAYEHECKDAVTWDRWVRSDDRVRPGVETLALQVDWANATNAELAEALAYWRPAHIKEPIIRSGAKRGKQKATDFEAWLRDLGVVRLFRYFKDEDARRQAQSEFGISRRDILSRSKSRAKRLFDENFLWLEGRRHLIASR